MRPTQRRARRGVRCTDCGPTLGHPAGIDQGGLRCGECGQFSEPCPTYCAKHEVHWGHLSGYDHCPACREEQRVRDREQELMARRADPQMHNMVDAQANAIDHSRPRGP